MKGWHLSRAAFMCGRCGERVESGLPMYVMQPKGLSHPKKRCANCAGERIPAGVLAEEPLGGTILTGPPEDTPISGMDSFRSAMSKVIPFDFKAAQAGDE